MGKSNANECNESSLSNCRVQLALSKKRDGVILEKTPSLRVRKVSVPYKGNRRGLKDY